MDRFIIKTRWSLDIANFRPFWKCSSASYSYDELQPQQEYKFFLELDYRAWHLWSEVVPAVCLQHRLGFAGLRRSSLHSTSMWWNTRRWQLSERHMNVCKLMLTEVFKWISEATLKPRLIQTVQRRTQWTTVQSNELQWDTSMSTVIVQLWLSRRCFNMSGCTFNQDVALAPDNVL